MAHKLWPTISAFCQDSAKKEVVAPNLCFLRCRDATTCGVECEDSGKCVYRCQYYVLIYVHVPCTCSVMLLFHVYREYPCSIQSGSASGPLANSAAAKKRNASLYLCGLSFSQLIARRRLCRISLLRFLASRSNVGVVELCVRNERVSRPTPLHLSVRSTALSAVTMPAAAHTTRAVPDGAAASSSTVD